MGTRAAGAVALLVWALSSAGFVLLAVVLDAAELPPFATSSRWAPPIGAALGIAAASLAFRTLRRSPDSKEEQ